MSCLEACIFDVLILLLLYLIYNFFLFLFKILCYYFQQFGFAVPWGVVFALLLTLGMWLYSLYQIWVIFGYYFFEYMCLPISFTPCKCMLDCFILFHRSLRINSFLKPNFFSLLHFGKCLLLFLQVLVCL